MPLYINARIDTYLATGADGIFIPELAELGVTRVSLGSSVAETAYAVMRRATKETLSTGTYTTLTDRHTQHPHAPLTPHSGHTRAGAEKPGKSHPVPACPATPPGWHATADGDEHANDEE